MMTLVTSFVLTLTLLIKALLALIGILAAATVFLLLLVGFLGLLVSPTCRGQART